MCLIFNFVRDCYTVFQTGSATHTRRAAHSSSEAPALLTTGTPGLSLCSGCTCMVLWLNLHSRSAWRGSASRHVLWGHLHLFHMLRIRALSAQNCTAVCPVCSDSRPLSHTLCTADTSSKSVAGIFIRFFTVSSDECEFSIFTKSS